jgi:hypothetical protein
VRNSPKLITNQLLYQLSYIGFTRGHSRPGVQKIEWRNVLTGITSLLVNVCRLQCHMPSIFAYLVAD